MVSVLFVGWFLRRSFRVACCPLLLVAGTISVAPMKRGSAIVSGEHYNADIGVLMDAGGPEGPGIERPWCVLERVGVQDRWNAEFDDPR